MKTNIFLSSLSSQNSETLALASRAASASAAKLLCSFIGTEQSLTFYDRNKIFRAVFTLQSKISLAFDLWSLICQSKITKWISTANYLDPLNDHPPASSYLFKFILVRNTQFRMLVGYDRWCWISRTWNSIQNDNWYLGQFCISTLIARAIDSLSERISPRVLFPNTFLTNCDFLIQFDDDDGEMMMVVMMIILTNWDF